MSEGPVSFENDIPSSCSLSFPATSSPSILLSVTSEPLYPLFDTPPVHSLRHLMFDEIWVITENRKRMRIYHALN